MTLVEGMGQDLDRENYVEEVNNKFKSQGLEAKIGLRADGYVVTYGKHSRKVALLSDNLQLLGEIVAIEGSKEDWNIEDKEDGTIKLTGYKKEKKGEIQIPNIIDGKFVTEIGTIFSSETGITSINIPEGIEIIGAKAFFGCTGLKCKIIFPSSLKEIGESAFYQCSGIQGDLNSIVEQGIKTGKNAFYKCGGMTGNIKVLIDTLGDDVVEIEENQFSGFSGLTGTLKIPERITKIGANAFSKCSGLTAIEFETESSLQEIGSYAFSQCTGVSNKLDLPDTVTTIGEYAFNECSNLTGVDISTTLTSLGKYAFYNCSNLSGTIKIPATLQIVDEGCFWGIGTKATETLEIDVGEGNHTLGGSAFRASRVCKVKLPESDSIEIGELCFYFDNNLESIENSKSISKIGARAFEVTGKLKTFEVNNNVELCDNAFQSCSLTSLDSFKNLTKLPVGCFNGCTTLNCDVIKFLKESEITELGDNAFLNCNGLTGDYSNDLKNKNNSEIKLGKYVFLGTSVSKSLNVDVDSNGYLSLDNNVTKIEDYKFADIASLKDNNGKEITTLKIPNSITEIGKEAFKGCGSIENIEIPYSVVKIGDGAFDSCTKLKKVEFKGEDENKLNLISIPKNCFANCKKLETIDIPESVTSLGDSSFKNTNISYIDLENIKTLGSSCFYCCYNLKDINVFNDKLTSIPSICFCNTKLGYKEGSESSKVLEIPDTITSIGSYAFGGCKELESIIIGIGVTDIPGHFVEDDLKLNNIQFKGKINSIGSYAFSNCSSLKTIKFADDTVLENIGANAFKNCSSLTGEITIKLKLDYDDENVFFNCPIKRKFVD